LKNKLAGSPIQKFSMTRVGRYAFMLVLIGIGLFILFREVDRLKVNDFIGYWSTSRLLISGGNPYSPDELLQVQQEGGLTRQLPHINYNPPWTLPITFLLGIFNRPTAQILWVLGQITALLYCTNRIWKLYGGPSKLRTIAWLITFTFSPVLAAVILQGQISPFMFIGLIGFLIFIIEPEKAWRAGIFAFLLLTKPQVTYLFFIAFFLWSFLKKKLSALIGFISTLLVANIIALAINPNIFNQYGHLMIESAPSGWATPTIGTYLRLAFNPTGFQLQFLPSLLGAIWLVIYWFKRRQVWDWKVEMPLILFITTITSAYIWTYDMVLLLLPLLLAFIWLIEENRRWISVIFVIGYLAIDVLYLWLHLRLDDSYFIWFAPALFVWYLVAQAVHNSTTRHLEVNKSV